MGSREEHGVIEKRNLLFIMTDHQRADSLGMVQAGMEVTPNLNRLAAQGATFTRAYNTCPLCVPARTALATGKYPTKNGIVFNDWKGSRAGDHKTIHECLAEAGYDVGHIGAHHIRVKPDLHERARFARWIEGSDYDSYAAAQDIGKAERSTVEVMERREGAFVPAKYSSARVSTWPHHVEHFRDNFFCRQAIEFLAERRTKPFALFINLWAPHPPLQVPEPYASMFAPDRVVLPPNVGLPARGEPPGRRRGVPAQLAVGVSLEDWYKAWGAHLGLVHLADAGIGRVLRALEESGQADETVVLFTADHGDHLGQHGMYQKMELYEQAIEVPLTIRCPGVKARRIDNPVSHLDVMPTLLDLMGIEIPEGLDGVSLAEQITTESSAPDRLVFCQYSGNPAIGDIRRGVVTRRYKYIYDPDDLPELYDLQDDPLEMNNLAGESGYGGLMRELHEQCASWGKSHGDWVEFELCRSSLP